MQDYRSGSVITAVITLKIMMDIKSEFDNIRKLYFPRWDKNNAWSVAYGTREQLRGNTAYCDTSATTVYLERNSFDRFVLAEVRAFLVHEISHDVGAAGHNRGWASRLEIAARHADKLGETDLAIRLRRHIFSYAGNGTLEPYNHDHVLDFTREVCQLTPNIQNDQLLKRVSKYFGFTERKVERDFGYIISDVVAGIA